MPILWFQPTQADVREMHDPLPFAAMDVRRAVVAFIDAANRAQTREQIAEIQTVLSDLTRELQAAAIVAECRREML